MKSTRTGSGLLFALLPVLYCGGLVYYFAGVPGRMQSSFGLPDGSIDMTKQLGPTIIGLGGFGVLFALLFVVRVMRAASNKAPRSPTAEVPDEEDAPFDADAALERYMARKAAGEIEPVGHRPVATSASSPVIRGFGRKGV